MLQTQTARMVKRRLLAVMTAILVMLWVLPATDTGVRVVLTALLAGLLLGVDIWTIRITEWLWDRRPHNYPALSGCGFCDYSGPVLFSEPGATAGICEACIRLGLQGLSSTLSSVADVPASCSFCNGPPLDRQLYGGRNARICVQCLRSFERHLPRPDGGPPIMAR